MPDHLRRETLAKLDQNMVKIIVETIVDNGPGVKWDDIQGLNEVKRQLMENIIFP
jgi:SpoVK/Ycf46/Vps4 family AAA+-type ATPase